MTITAVSQWSTDESLNVDLNGIPTTENVMRPRHVNNAFREMMAQLASAGFVHGTVFTRVRVVTTSNVTLSAPGATLDGVTMATGDLFLAQTQTAPAEVGIYKWNGAASAATRTPGFTAYDDHPGVYVSVMEGTASADTIWRCTSDKGGTLGTDPLVFRPALLEVDATRFGLSPNATPAANAAALQAAIDYVITRGSGKIFVPNAPGGYEIGATLEVFYHHRNGSTTAPTSGTGENRLAGVYFVGEGSSTLDSVFDAQAGTTLIYTGTDPRGLFDLASDCGARFDRIRFIGNSGVATDQLIRMRSFDAPIFSATGTVFNECSFVDESDLISGAIVTMRERKHVEFNSCLFPTGTDAMRIGEDAGVNSTLMDGSVTSLILRNTVFAGNIRLRKAAQVLFETCEWFPRKGTTVGARIYMDGNADVENVTFENPKAMFDGDGTAYFFTQVAGARGLVVIGGAIGDYARAFSLAGMGPVLIHGTSFDNTEGDVVLNSDSLFPVDIRGDHSRTLAGSGIGVVDNRTPANTPTTADLSLTSNYTLPSAATTWQTPTGLSKSIDIRGGLHRVSYGLTVTTGIDQTINVRLAIPGEVQQSIATEFVPAGATKTISFSRDIDLTGTASAVTVSLQVRHSSFSSATVVKAAASSTAGTFLQVKPI